MAGGLPWNSKVGWGAKAGNGAVPPIFLGYASRRSREECIKAHKTFSKLPADWFKHDKQSGRRLLVNESGLLCRPCFNQFVLAIDEHTALAAVRGKIKPSLADYILGRKVDNDPEVLTMYSA